MTLVKYAPFTDSEDFPTGVRIFQDTINRLLSDQTATRPWAPSVDIFETENELVAGRKQQGFPPFGAELRLLRAFLYRSGYGRH